VQVVSHAAALRKDFMFVLRGGETAPQNKKSL
jgi:hypothetical protein